MVPKDRASGLDEFVCGVNSPVELPSDVPSASVWNIDGYSGRRTSIYAFITWRPTIAVGNNSVVHWLGVRVIHLYLVHEPIVVSVAFFLHATNPFYVALIAVPLSLLAAEVFFRMVERPSHRLAGLAGRVVADRVRSADEDVIADAKPTQNCLMTGIGDTCAWPILRLPYV